MYRNGSCRPNPRPQKGFGALQQGQFCSGRHPGGVRLETGPWGRVPLSCQLPPTLRVCGERIPDCADGSLHSGDSLPGVPVSR